MSSNLYDNINTWLNNSDEEIDLIFLTTNKNLLTGMISNLLQISKVRRIVLSKKVKRTDYASYDERVIDIEEFKETQGKVYCFLDFENSIRIMGNDSFSYSKKVEWEPLFRRNCISIMMYQYTGKNIVNGYWTTTSHNDSIQIKILELSEWGLLSQSIPTYDGPNMGGQNIHNSELIKTWIDSLSEFVEYIIRFIFREDKMFNVDEVVEFFKTDTAMTTMVKSMTHSTQNAIYNYESNEHHGDNLFRTHFTTYLHTTFRRITNQESSGFVLRYLSKEYQNFWSDDLYLVDRILKHNFVTHTLKLKTDAIEAFLGGLGLIAYDMSPGFDFLLINRFFMILFKSIPFDKDLIFGKAKQKVIQVNEMSGFDKNSIRIDKTETEDSRKSFLSIMVSSKLQEFFNTVDLNSMSDKTKQKNISDKNGLSTIGKKHFDYNPVQMSRAAAENEVWEYISSVYDANGFTLVDSYIRDNFFDILERYDYSTYKRFIDMLEEKFSDMDENNLNKIHFNKSLFENFIVLYKSPVPNGPGTMSTNSLSRYETNSRLSDDYQQIYEGVIQDENLAIVEFPTKAQPIGKYTKATPLEYGKYQAILLYLSR